MSTERLSIPPDKLLRAMLLQAFYSIRSERQLMERLEFDLLFRWLVGLGIDNPVIRCSRRTAIQVRGNSEFCVPVYRERQPAL